MKEQITYDTYDKVDIRVGTVISVKKNEKARKPSLVVEVDFGNEIGVNIAGVVSQVLILGSIDKEGKVVLVHPSQNVENGLPVA